MLASWGDYIRQVRNVERGEQSIHDWASRSTTVTQAVLLDQIWGLKHVPNQSEAVSDSSERKWAKSLLATVARVERTPPGGAILSS